jgi:hypothetical protein
MFKLFLVSSLFLLGQSLSLKSRHHKKKHLIGTNINSVNLHHSVAGDNCKEKFVNTFSNKEICLYHNNNLCKKLAEKTLQLMETDKQVSSMCEINAIVNGAINNGYYYKNDIIDLEKLYCQKKQLPIKSTNSGAETLQFDQKDSCLCQYMFGDVFTNASQTTCTNATHTKKGNVCFDENASPNDLSQCTLSANDCETCIHNINNNWCTADPECSDSCGQNSKLYKFWKIFHKDDQIDCANHCDDIPINNAFLDDCDTCSGGSSGHTANSDQDCADVCFGTATLDSCDTCSGGSSGHTANSDQDCADVCFGTATLDSCDTCSGGSSNHTANSDQDCAYVCFGTATLDSCDTCSGGSSNHTANSDQDCAGVCFGSALIDNCTVCSGGISNHTANSDQDCAGTCDGIATTDLCGTCDANAQNDCVSDCEGAPGGTATTDLCGTCDDDAENDCVHIPSIAEVISDIDEFTGVVNISTKFYIAYDLTRSYANNELLTTSQTAAAAGTAYGYPPEQYTNTTLQSLASVYGSSSYQTGFLDSDLTSADIVAQTDLSAYKSPYIDGATHYTLETTESTWALKYSNGHSILSGTRTNTTLVGLPSPGSAMIEFPVSFEGTIGYQVVDDYGIGIQSFNLKEDHNH